MRRDSIYLGALVAVAASIVEFGFVSMLAVIGPAWALRHGPLRPVWTAPLVVGAVAVVGPVLLDVLGGECPREGMDHLGECNALASAGLLVFSGGVITLQVAVLAAVCAVMFRAGWVVVMRRTRRP